MTNAIRLLLLPLAVCLVVACSDDDDTPPDTGPADVVAPDKSPTDTSASDFDAIPPDCVDCKGCCQSSQCKDGTKDNACGKDGEVCALCGLQEHCVLGVCEPQGGLDGG